MKKIFLIFILGVVCSTHIFATFIYNGIYYDPTSGTTVEVGIRPGERPDLSGYAGNSYYSGDIVIPATVYDGATEYTVTGVGENAFAYAPGVTSVLLPEGIEYIRGFAFRGSAMHPSALTSVNIPSTVKVLGNSAFQGCDKLIQISLPKNLEKIERYCFYQCKILKFSDAALPSTLTTLGQYAFYECLELEQIVIPEGITAIGDYTFNLCSSLELVTLPSSLTSIGIGAFSSCALTGIAIPGQVSFIGSEAFADCKFTSVEIPEGITTIQSNTFNGCSNLSFVVLPSTLQTIGQDAFRGNTALQSITIPYGVQTIGSRAFGYSGLTSVTLPETVVNIENGAFINCSGLVSVDVLAPVLSIGYGAFQLCPSLGQFSLAAQNPADVTIDVVAFLYGGTPVTPVLTSTVLMVPCSTSAVYSSSTSEFSYFFSIQDKTNCAIVTTLPANSITQTSAVLNGSVNPGSESVSAKGFQYRKVADSGWITEPDNNLAFELDNLDSYTLYIYRAYAVTGKGTIYGDEQIFKTLAVPPAVTVDPVASVTVTKTGAVLSGSITQGSEEIISRGFEYKESSESAWKTVYVTAGGPFEAALTGLTSCMIYECRSFAITLDGGKFYSSNEEEFETLGVAPTLTTGSPSGITLASAVVSGTVTGCMGLFDYQGFEYKKASESAWTVVSPVPGVLTATLINLLSGTKYEYRAFAHTTEDVRIYGDTKDFTTLAAPTVVTRAATGIKVTSATISGSITKGWEPVDGRGFEYRKTGDILWIVLESDSYMKETLSGLTGNTTYEYKAYAITESDTYYGDTLTFTTHTAPTVTTSEVDELTDIDETSVFVSGALAQGTETITTKGFEYKKESDETWQIEYCVDDDFEAQLTGLDYYTTYDYRAFVITPSGTFRGSEEQFTTGGGNELDEYMFITGKISLYPNPAATTVNLKVEGVDPGLITVIITDMQGRIVAQLKGKEATGIDVGHYNKGVYLVRILGEDPLFERVEKLIVK